MPTKLINPEAFSAKRAAAVKLVVLPTNITGKKCSTCDYFNGSENGFCSHPEVSMSVNGYWACKEWSNSTVVPVVSPGQLDELVKSGENDVSVKAHFNRVQSTISRFNRNQINELADLIESKDIDDETRIVAHTLVSRFSDCGHDEGGFAAGNTCGSLRGKGGKEHHAARAKHHEERFNRLSEHNKKLIEKLQKTQALMEKSKKRAEHHKGKAESLPSGHKSEKQQDNTESAAEKWRREQYERAREVENKTKKDREERGLMAREELESERVRKKEAEKKKKLNEENRKLSIERDKDKNSGKSEKSSESKPESAKPDSKKIAHEFDSIFEKLDRKSGGDNFVKLSDMRKSMSHLSKDEFNNHLKELRKSGIFTLDSHEGLHGSLSQDDRDAAIHESGTRYIYLSRR